MTPRRVHLKWSKTLACALILGHWALASDTLAEALTPETGFDSSRNTKAMSPADLSIKSENIFTKAYEILAGVFKNRGFQDTMHGTYQRGSEARKNFTLREANISLVEPTQGAGLEVKNSFQNGATVAFAKELEMKSEMVRQLTGSLNFEFDAVAILRGQSNATAHTTRYGLIPEPTTDIDTPLWADSAGDRYTIGPISDPEPQPEILPPQPATGKAPSTKFRGRFDPQVQGPGAGPNRFGMRLTLVQAQDYYQMSVPVLPKPNSKAMEHQFKVPAYRRVAVGEKTDATFKPIQSSVFNVFDKQSGAQVNAHYLHRELAVSPELAWAGPGYKFSVVGKVPRSWVMDDGLAKPGSSYRLDYTLDL